MSYAEVIESLRAAYDQAVDAREEAAERAEHTRAEAWKAAERQRFLDHLRGEDRLRLLEVGAGTGIHGRFFQSQGLAVVCTDLSPQMVALCTRKGLEAHVMDF